MNALCYKIVFSKRLGTLVAVGEHTAGQGKAAGTGVRTVVFPSSSAASADNFVGLLKSVFASVALSFVTVGYATAAGPAVNTLPTGYSVNSGNVAISSTSSATNAAMTINQTTDKASVNWNSFSIGSGAAVNVQQNNANSVLLNRVVGNDPSQIFGKLTANGQVILINPNGVVFGKGGSVTASAFTASTFGMTDADFLAGKHKFSRNGSTAGVTVEDGATIDTTGYVALIGAGVDNQGTITTQGGAVVLASGDSVALPSALTDNISVPLSGKVRLELLPSTINAMVANSGTITTEGGQVLMQAAALSDAVASITHTGTIDTTGVQGGAVTLQADHGIIKATGTIKANSKNAKNKGGDIYIGRDEKTNILAKATNVNGAKLESLGGFVETSGEYLETKAVSVKAKDWLLDPTNIRIVGSGTTTAASSTTSGANPETTFNGPSGINDSLVFRDDIQNAINVGTSVKIDTANSTPGANGSGNITIETALNFVNNTTNAATLSLLAKNGITQNSGASITNKGSGLVHVVMVAEGLPGGNSIAAGTNNTNSNGITLNSTITTNGDVTITGTSANNMQHGVRFSTGSGIDARSYNVTGRMTANSGGSQGAAQGSGVVFTGTSVFKSTADSRITASTASTGSASVFGMHFHNGSNVTFDTGNAKLVAATDAANMGGGVKIGWAGNAVINTKGDVTLGSMNTNAGTHMQGTINALSGSVTLKGNAVGHGVWFQDGNQIGATIVGTNGANINIEGTSTGSVAGVHTNFNNAGKTVIYTSGTSSANTAGNISITGESTSGEGIINSGAVGSNIINTSTGTSTKGNITLIGTSKSGNKNGINSTGLIAAAGLVKMTGNAKGTRAGVNVGAKVEGGGVDIYGSSTGGTGIDITGLVNTTDATNTTGVTLTGFGGSTYQNYNHGIWIRTVSSAVGSVNSASTVNITGNNNFAPNTANSSSGAVIEGSITANGNILIEGNTNSTSTVNSGLVIKSQVKSTSGTITARAHAANQNNTSLVISGSGELVTTNKDINLVANSMNFTGATAINAGNATVSIKAKDVAVKIQLGLADTTATTPELRLDQAELNKITAGNTIIGDSANTGGIIVAGSSAVTTASGTGHLTLQTAGNIAINQGLTVGIDGSGSATKNLTLNGVGTTSTITQGAAIKAAGLELLGANATHTLTNAGNQVATLAANTKAVDYFNSGALTLGSVNTDGINASGDVSIATGTGNLTITKNVATSATALKLNAARSAGVGAAVGSDNSGNIIVSGGSVSVGAGGTAQLMTGSITGDTSAAALASAGNFRYNSDETTTNYSKALSTKSGGNNGINVIYREKPTVTIKVNDVTKVYDGIAHSGGSFATTAVTAGLQNGDTVAMAGANVLFSGTAQSVKDVLASSGKTITAADNGKNALGYGVTYTDGSLTINKATLQQVNAAKTYDGLSTVTGGQLTSIKGIGTETFKAAATDSATITGKDVLTANNKVTSTSGLNLTGNAATTLASNYDLTATPLASAVTIGKATLQQVNASKTYDGLSTVTGGQLTSIKGIGTETFKAAATDSATITGKDVLTANNKVTSTSGLNLTGNAATTLASNYDLTATPLASAVTVTQKEVTLAASKEYDGMKTLTGSQLTIGTGITGEFIGYSAATINSKNVVDNAINYVDSVTLANNGTTLASNYKAPSAAVAAGKNTVTLSAKEVTLTGTSVADKTYDGNTSATVTNTGTLNGLVVGETLDVTATGSFINASEGNQKPVRITGVLADRGGNLATNYRLANAQAIANITAAIKPPSPVVPTDSTPRVKIPVGSANPFALASAEDLADDTCTANSIENCYCESSPLNANVDICYEPKAGAKGAAR